MNYSVSSGLGITNCVAMGSMMTLLIGASISLPLSLSSF